eukprot:Hpha_TRINITY_DN11180_c0_g1::TRINITY_DN11180_c0_g1_i1::g.27950::m.27950
MGRWDDVRISVVETVTREDSSGAYTEYHVAILPANGGDAIHIDRHRFSGLHPHLRCLSDSKPGLAKVPSKFVLLGRMSEKTVSERAKAIEAILEGARRDPELRGSESFRAIVTYITLDVESTDSPRSGPSSVLLSGSAIRGLESPAAPPSPCPPKTCLKQSPQSPPLDSAPRVAHTSSRGLKTPKPSPPQSGHPSRKNSVGFQPSSDSQKAAAAILRAAEMLVDAGSVKTAELLASAALMLSENPVPKADLVDVLMGCASAVAGSEQTSSTPRSNRSKSSKVSDVRWRSAATGLVEAAESLLGEVPRKGSSQARRS